MPKKDPNQKVKEEIKKQLEKFATWHHHVSALVEFEKEKDGRVQYNILVSTVKVVDKTAPYSECLEDIRRVKVEEDLKLYREQWKG